MGSPSRLSGMGRHGLGVEHHVADQRLRVAARVGAERLGEDGEWATLWLYLLGSMLAGVAATGAGWLLGEALR